MHTGRIFQRHWTVHYGKAGIQPSDGARFVSRLLDMIGKQARREGGRLAAIWVRECASEKGEHVHIMLHLPAGMSLRNRTRRWIEAAGGTAGKGVSRVTIIGGRLPAGTTECAGRYRENAQRVVNYILKGADPETGERRQLLRWGERGRIVGKRCGWTQNLGRKTRVLHAQFGEG